MSLNAIGVSAFDEQVYRDLLRMPNSTVARLAVLQSHSPAQIRAAVRRLQDAGLVQRAATRAGELQPVDPRIAVTALARQRRAELEHLGAVAEKLAADFHEGSLRQHPDQLVKVIDGAEEVARWFGHLHDSATHDVMLLIAPPYASVEYPPSDEAAMIASGVRFRVIYGREQVTGPGIYAEIARDIARGELARMLPVVPLKLLIIDGVRAFLPLSDSEHGTRDGAVLVERSQLTDALVQLFETLWKQAVPLSPPVSAPGDDGEPIDTRSAADRDLLRLMAAGLPDDSIAAQLGISERTLRRRITSLLDRLGSISRFQAGAQAARLGWM